MQNSVNVLQKTLPFDQYARQEIVSFLINEGIRQFSKKKKLSIIDLGGHKGQTTFFQPEDKVNILDVFDEEYEGYIKGDATNTDFKDGAFDVACSFDVLEHIPRDKRQAFIHEGLRISKYGFLVALPIDINGHVSAAEKLLNEFHRVMFDTDHMWLKEHIDYKIPTDNEIKDLVKNAQAVSTRVSSNQLGDWQLMQMLIFSAAQNPEITECVNEVNRWYNGHTLTLDAGADVGYRGIYYISKNAEHVQAIETLIESLRQDHANKASFITINNKTFHKFSVALAKISRKYTHLSDKYSKIDSSRQSLIEENTHLKAVLEGFKTHNQELTAEIHKIYESKSWKITRPMRAASKYSKRMRRK